MVARRETKTGEEEVSSPARQPFTVTVKLGCTLPVGDMGFVKPEITLNEIDPAGDVDHQLTLGIEVASQAFARIDDQLEVTLSQLMSPVTGVASFRDTLTALAKSVDTIRENNKRMTAKLKEILPFVEAEMAKRAATREDAPVD